MFPALAFTAPPGVAHAVGSLGRTEDVRFSPGRRRLAIASFFLNRIAVFDVEISSAREVPHVALTGGVLVSSPALRSPHGVDFLDERTLIVTSRDGDVSLLALPPGDREVSAHVVAPLARWPADTTTGLSAPGSVTVTHGDDGRCEILICNNAGHTVTRHLAEGHALAFSRVLLRKHLAIPDGVCVSPDRRWIAVSNHTTHNVLLYENTPALHAGSEPEGILRRLYYPHGLRFSADGRHLFVADAGAPCLHVYAADGEEWRGVHLPLATVRIMDDATFRKGQLNPQEGGPKGLDIDPGADVLVVTSECQPLAFFDVPTLLDHARAAGGSSPETRRLDLSHELTVMQEIRSLTAATADARALQTSLSWRVTAPLRRIRAAFRRDSSRGVRTGPRRDDDHVPPPRRAPGRRDRPLRGRPRHRAGSTPHVAQRAARESRRLRRQGHHAERRGGEPAGRGRRPRPAVSELRPERRHPGRSRARPPPIALQHRAGDGGRHLRRRPATGHRDADSLSLKTSG